LYAKGLFDAFEEHDLIDAGLEHCEWVLEQWLRERGPLSAQDRSAIFGIIQCFALFYRGIERHCSTQAEPLLRPRPRSQVVCLQDVLH
jgi:hypothetical protein